MRQEKTGRTRFAMAMVLSLALAGASLGEEIPVLEADLDALVSLDFTDAPVGEILDVIGSTGRLQFVFDTKVDLNEKTTVSLSDLSVRDALRFFVRSHDLFHVFRDSTTVLIAPDTRQKRQEHMPRAIRTFKLDHADGKNVIVVLRTLLQTRDLALNDRLNTVTMNDTLVQLDLAEEIIDRIDRESGDVERQTLWIGSELVQDAGWMGDAVPRLELDADPPVTLEKDMRVAHQLYEALSEATGLQFLFDRDVDHFRSATLEVRGLPAREALDLVNRQLGNFSVAWGPRTVFVAPDVRWRRMKDEHAAIGFFYLSHAEPQEAVTLLRSAMQTRQIAVVPRLNAVLVLEGMAKLATAKELIAGIDRADGTVAAVAAAEQE